MGRPGGVVPLFFDDDDEASRIEARRIPSRAVARVIHMWQWWPCKVRAGASG